MPAFLVERKVNFSSKKEQTKIAVFKPQCQTKLLLVLVLLTKKGFF